MDTAQSDLVGILLEHFRKSDDPNIVKRSQVIMLHLKGHCVRDIGEFCFQKERTIYRWIQKYEKCGVGSIFPGYYQNQNASKLTREQKRAVKLLLEDQDFPVEYWSLGSLKKYISARFDVLYQSENSYYTIFSMCNYSYKLPSLFNIRRDDKYVESRIKEIREEIKPCLEDEGYLVFTSDETRVEWNTLKRRAWLKKGKKTIIKEKREKNYQNFIGFLNLVSGEDLLYQLDWQNQEHIIPVLTSLVERYPNKKIIIIWDNAGFHRGKKIRELLGKGNKLENIHLIWLPPYAPDTNPQEMVWRYAKDQISNMVFNQFKELVETFEASITGRKFKYKF
jgi:transposase